MLVQESALTKMVYGVEMTLPMDLMLGDTGREQPEQECPFEYVEWIKDSLRRAHSRACKTLKTATKRNVNAGDTESRIGLFDFTAVNGSGEPTPVRAESYGTLTGGPGWC